jgi:heterodisulfide reductase subunit A
MYSIKHAYQAIDHGVQDITVLYMDIRSYGKGFDGFWTRTLNAGADFIRGRPAKIQPNGKVINVLYENIDSGKRVVEDFDMVVLANAVTPPGGLYSLATRLNIELDGDGFIRTNEKLGGMVMTTRPGIYTAGCVSGPKDIPDSVAEGSGAAALALTHLSSRDWPEPLDIEPIADIDTPRVGVFVCECGSNIAGVVNVKKVVESARSFHEVVCSTHQMFSCAGNTQAEIEELIRDEGVNRVVIAACSPKTHESIFRGVLERSGLNPYLLEMSNIRNMDSWVHKFDKTAATDKAVDMVSMAVEKARQLVPLDISQLPLKQSVLVIGGGISGMTAAAALARQGFETHLVETQSELGGMMKDLDHIAPSALKANEIIQAKIRELDHPNIALHLETKVETIGGVVGSYQARLSNGLEFTVGAVVVATGGQAYKPTEFGFGTLPHTITNLELERLLAEAPLGAEAITFISCVGSRQGKHGCSRYCCTSMILQALQLREMGKKVRVVSKDIRTYSRQSEELYARAMRAGVQFFRYADDKPPQDAIEYHDGHIEFHDLNLRKAIRIPTDLLVLVVGLHPADTTIIDQLKLSRSEDGFLMELHPKLGPAETAVQGVFLAGVAQGAKDVRESMAQAMAAAGKVGALLSRGVIKKEPLAAKLAEDLCPGCMRCVRVCPYNAIEQVGDPGEKGAVRIIEAACMGCGTCAAECNFDAIEMPYFTKGQILAQIDAALENKPAEKCLVFTCNWCSYAGADLAGIEKRQYPTSARIIRTMCSARFEEDFVSRSFENGAGAVLITGCRLTESGSDCHYNAANIFTEKRFRRWQKKFARQGVEPDRLQLRWISAAEGKEFAEKITEMDEVIKRHLSRLQQLEPIGE